MRLPRKLKLAQNDRKEELIQWQIQKYRCKIIQNVLSFFIEATNKYFKGI